MATLKQLVDETTNIKNELKTCHTNLKNNLIDKGVECSDSDKLLSLANKVGEIELGKKWASGQVSLVSDNANKFYFIQENIKFDFNPSIFIAYLANRTYSNVNPFSLLVKDVYAFTSTSSDMLKVFTNSNMYDNGVYLNNTGFKVIVYNYTNLTNASQYKFNWIAIE